MQDYTLYDKLISEMLLVSKKPIIARKTNLIFFKDIVITTIILRIVWVTAIHLIVSMVLIEKYNYEKTGIIYFIIALLFTIYRSSISYNTFILDLHKKKIYHTKYKKIKKTYPFNEIEKIQIKQTETNYVTQHRKILIQKDIDYELQITFNDNQTFIFGDFKNSKSAEKYCELFRKLLFVTPEGELSAEKINQIMDKEFEGIADNDEQRKQKAFERTLMLIDIEKEKRKIHEHQWVSQTNSGRDICTICGEESSSPWDC